MAASLLADELLDGGQQRLPERFPVGAYQRVSLHETPQASRHVRVETVGDLR